MILSALDKLNIRAVIKEVTDSFFVTTIEYLSWSPELSRFNEDNSDGKFTTYLLQGLKEDSRVSDSKASDSKASDSGSIDRKIINITFNTEDLITANLYDTINFLPKLHPETDFMIVSGIKYKVTRVSNDGQLDSQNILVIVTGEQVML